jgi:hypothetical protein
MGWQRGQTTQKGSHSGSFGSNNGNGHKGLLNNLFKKSSLFLHRPHSGVKDIPRMHLRHSKISEKNPLGVFFLDKITYDCIP